MTEADPDILTLDLDGWEGPLDLLLALARSQKVDLKAISILSLVEQYLAYVNAARSLRLELAADYLVMAAWLAYLKSALLLPRDPGEVPSPEDLALRLQLRLERLNAMREAGARLMARDRLGRDVFVRGAPEGVRTVRTARWQAELYDLIAAYGRVSARSRPVMHVVAVRRRHDAGRRDNARVRADRHPRGLGDDRDVPARRSRPAATAARRSPPASSPRWSWRGRGGWSCARPAPLPRCT